MSTERRAIAAVHLYFFTCTQSFHKSNESSVSPPPCIFIACLDAISLKRTDLTVSAFLIKLNELDNGFFRTVATTGTEKVYAGITAALSQLFRALRIFGSDFVEELFH